MLGGGGPSLRSQGDARRRRPEPDLRGARSPGNRVPSGAVPALGILEAVRRIELYTGSKPYEEFAEDILVQDGVLRNLANLGEAVKRLPAELTDLQPQIEWRKIVSLRDILVHEYGGVDLEIVCTPPPTEGRAS